MKLSVPYPQGSKTKTGLTISSDGNSQRQGIERERDTGGKNPQAVSAGAGETRLEQVHITQPGPTLGVPCRPGSEQPRANQSLLVWQRFSSGEDEQFRHILFSQQGLSNDFCAKKLSCC